eukprot:TRINITY_DN779801_c0_g1_i1.p1 TRINITY_DN779801_c0_g1~~TRINITY_DN779801_c0_g1_i1.p1  ORF type:complete len:400 (+),score=60.77 TRINITY_DN779801_c0_g1_i1:118-1317(+)
MQRPIARQPQQMRPNPSARQHGPTPIPTIEQFMFELVNHMAKKEFHKINRLGTLLGMDKRFAVTLLDKCHQFIEESNRYNIRDPQVMKNIRNVQFMFWVCDSCMKKERFNNWNRLFREFHCVFKLLTRLPKSEENQKLTEKFVELLGVWMACIPNSKEFRGSDYKQCKAIVKDNQTALEYGRYRHIHNAFPRYFSEMRRKPRNTEMCNTCRMVVHDAVYDSHMDFHENLNKLLDRPKEEKQLRSYSTRGWGAQHWLPLVSDDMDDDAEEIHFFIVKDPTKPPEKCPICGEQFTLERKDGRWGHSDVDTHRMRGRTRLFHIDCWRSHIASSAAPAPLTNDSVPKIEETDETNDGDDFFALNSDQIKRLHQALALKRKRIVDTCEGCYFGRELRRLYLKDI